MLSVWKMVTNIPPLESAYSITKGFYSFVEPIFKVDIYRADA